MYLARDILAFVMYCAFGESRSSLLIESTDCMIYTPALSLRDGFSCVRYIATRVKCTRVSWLQVRYAGKDFLWAGHYIYSFDCLY